MAAEQRTHTSTPPTPRVALGYARASTRHQEASVADQTANVKRWCADNGYPFDADLVWADDGISGAENDRPGLRALLDYVQRHPDPEDGVIVIWARDRLTRDEDPRTGLVLELQIEQAGWRPVFLDDQANTGDVTIDTVMATFAHAKSAQENLSRAQAATRGLIRRAQSGKASGRLPYGYRRHVTSADGTVRIVARTTAFNALKSEQVRWEPDPSEAPVVERIFDLYLKGNPSGGIAGTLNAEGIPSPRGKRWSDTTVLGILRSEHYVGTAKWNQGTQGRYFRVKDGKGTRRKKGGPRYQKNDPDDVIVIEHHHDPIIDQDTFKAAQRRLDQQKRCKGRKRQRAKLSPLNGLISCGCCGSGMRQTDWGKGRRYVCGGASKGICERFYVESEHLEVTLVERLQHMILPLREEVIENLRDLARERLGVDAHGNAEAERLRQQAAKLEEQIDQGTKNLGVVPPKVAATLGKQIGEWQDELEDLRREITRHETRQEVCVDLERAVQGAAQMFDTLAEADPNNTQQVRTVLQSFLGSVILNFVSQDPPKGKKRRIKEFTGGTAQITALIAEHLPEQSKQPGPNYTHA